MDQEQRQQALLKIEILSKQQGIRLLALEITQHSLRLGETGSAVLLKPEEVLDISERLIGLLDKELPS